MIAESFLLIMLASDEGRMAKPLVYEFTSMSQCLAAGFDSQRDLAAKFPWAYIHVNSCLEGAKARPASAKVTLTYTVYNGKSRSQAQVGLDSMAACYKFATHLSVNTFDPDGVTYKSADCRMNGSIKK